MSGIPFTKMHGLGNDFVVLDARGGPIALSAEQVRAIADRKTGVGCDQFITVEQPVNDLADAFMRIHNANGGEVEACGNAARCIAAMVMDEKNTDHAIIETAAGLLDASRAGDGMITVDMGPARLDWRDIPLSEAVDTLHLGIEEGPLNDPAAINIGNPHAVFFVDDVESIPLEDLGPVIERHPLFPRYTNVEAVQVTGETSLRVRVWERGVGITRACGTGACAALVAANRRGLTLRAAEVTLDGGPLRIEWLKDNHVAMTGPVAVSFTGAIGRALLG